jgi:PAS domain S-box-containing protein
MKKKKPSSASRVRPLNEAEETLLAIREGGVDAFVVRESEGHRVYALEDCDLPYSVLVERMQQGAVMLNRNGEIIYGNVSFAQLMNVPRESLIGVPLQQFLAETSREESRSLLRVAQEGESEGEMLLRRADGTLVSAHFAFRLLTRDKSAIGVLITDLTARKHEADLVSRLQRMQDDERRRIARELHDSVGQLLVAIGMNISTVQTEAHKLSPEVSRLVTENGNLVKEISNEIRTISHLLHPPLLDEVGLPSALRWYIEGFADRSKIEATLDIPDDLERLPQDLEIAIFRAVQECLTNVHRHSGSPSCSVKIIRDKDHVRLEIRDSGRGIPEAMRSTLPSLGGVGLRGMKERFRQLGGTMILESSQTGTVVKAAFPVPAAPRPREDGEDVA